MLKKIGIEDVKKAIGDDGVLEEHRSFIKDGGVIVFQNSMEKKLVLELKSYLKNIGKSSLPNYQKIEKGAPNFHRLNLEDERAYVKGQFHQFVFYPWNQDVFSLFEMFKVHYQYKNRLSGVDKNKFIGSEPDENCTARVAFQLYPTGGGYLNKHKDPVASHQLVVPVMIMSKKPEDFETGGLYVESPSGERAYVDELCEIGDTVYFEAQQIHGVDAIDKDKPLKWLDFNGRWMALLAVNKLSSNDEIPDSIDLDS